MTVTVEVLRQVEEELAVEGFPEGGVGFLICKRELAGNPDTELAEKIRNAYYNDGSNRALYWSKDSGQWLRMAAAARKFLQSQTEPRVFNRGDDIPADVIAVLTADGRTAVRTATHCKCRYLIPDEGSDFATIRAAEHGWDFFSIGEYPLTAVAVDELTLSKPGPRTWETIRDVPDDVLQIRDRDGNLFEKRPERHWYNELHGHFAPYTEVIDE